MLVKRIKEWITTVLGMILLAGSAFLTYKGTITIGEFTAFLPVCMGLLWAKNSFITDLTKLGKGGAAVITLLLITSTGCRTQLGSAPPVSPISTSSSSASTVSSGGERQEGYTKPDSASIKALLYCDSIGNVQMRYIAKLESGRNVKPEMKIKDNYIYLKCTVDSAEVWNKWSRFREQKSDTVTETRYLPGEVTNVLTWFQKFMIKLGWAFTLSFVLFVLWILYKLKFK